MKSRAAIVLVAALIIYFILLLYFSFLLFVNGNILGGLWLFLGVILTIVLILLVKGANSD